MFNKSIDLFHCHGKNFGDSVNPILLERIFGLPCASVPKTKAKMIALGSILQRFTTERSIFSVQKMFYPCLHVWTSGFISDIDYKHFKRNIAIYAVRGHLTKKKCEKMLGKELDVAVGDGGLLLSRLIEKPVQKKHALGIIPHVHDFGNPIFKKIKEVHKNAVIIDLSKNPMVVLREIAACECIISTAMHGLIAADSLGIPNQWILVSNNIEGHGFKFRDYYSAFGLNDMRPKILSLKNGFGAEDLKHVHDVYQISQKSVEAIGQNLINAFPYK